MKWQKIIIWILRLIFAIAIILHGLNWSKQWMLMSGFLLMFLPELIAKISRINIPMNGRLALDLFIFASQYLGSHLGFYGLFYWWDTMLHLSSGALIGYFLLIYLVYLVPELLTNVKHDNLLIISFIVAGSIAGAGLWEIWEFAGDMLFGLQAQLGSLRDTMIDIICGTIGGGLFAAYIGIQNGRHKDKIIGSLLRADVASSDHKQQWKK